MLNQLFPTAPGLLKPSFIILIWILFGIKDSTEKHLRDKHNSNQSKELQGFKGVSVRLPWIKFSSKAERYLL